MIPPIYSWLNVDPVNEYASGRLYPLGDAGESPTYPYVVWQTVSSRPENYMGEAPSIDNPRVQVDVYARDKEDVLLLADAVRSELDKYAHEQFRRGPVIEPETQSYRVQFDYSIWYARVPTVFVGSVYEDGVYE